MTQGSLASAGTAGRLSLVAGVAGLLVFAVWDVVLAVTGAGLGNVAWWGGVAAGAGAAALWIRWARRPLAAAGWRWRPWQWATALPLVVLPFLTRTEGGPPAALGYESVAYLACLVVLWLRSRHRDVPPLRNTPPRNPATMRRPTNRG